MELPLIYIFDSIIFLKNANNNIIVVYLHKLLVKGIFVICY